MFSISATELSAAILLSTLDVIIQLPAHNPVH